MNQFCALVGVLTSVIIPTFFQMPSSFGEVYSDSYTLDRASYLAIESQLAAGPSLARSSVREAWFDVSPMTPAAWPTLHRAGVSLILREVEGRGQLILSINRLSQEESDNGIFQKEAVCRFIDQTQLARLFDGDIAIAQLKDSDCQRSTVKDSVPFFESLGFEIKRLAEQANITPSAMFTMILKKTDSSLKLQRGEIAMGNTFETIEISEAVYPNGLSRLEVRLVNLEPKLDRKLVRFGRYLSDQGFSVEPVWYSPEALHLYLSQKKSKPDDELIKLGLFR